MMERPCARRPLRMPRMRSMSASDSVAVGSSRISTRAVASQQARDLDQLALTDGQRANRAIEIPVGKTERRQGLLRAQADLGPPVQKRNLGAAKPNIVEDRQMRREAELLRH